MTARTDSRFKALLESLAPGQVMWLSAGGNSLWPFVLDGDSLQVRRCGEEDVRRGDVAVVVAASGELVAHFVVGVAPVRTASSNGRLDAPARAVLGKVLAVRRRGVVLPLPAAARWVLRWVPAASNVLRRVPGAGALVRRWRDGA
ncbi:MAG: hypothetical protein AB1938_13395 [Myxococcota bacterium]